MGITLISVFWGRWKFVVLGFCFLFLCLGIWHHQQAVSQAYFPEEEDVIFVGRVVQEPDVRENNTRLIVETEEIPGKILLTVEKYPQYRYGDRLRVAGRLQSPSEDINGFNYKDYLKKDGIYSVIYWSNIDLLERGKYKNINSLIYAKILEFKQGLRESIYRNLPYPQSSILGAMILGDKSRLSEDLKQKLNLAGVRHVTAISGLHVTILTCILMQLLIGLGLWRRQAFYFSIILVVFFIIMTGFQPSAIRAGIMGGIFLLAQHLGRINIASRTVFFAAAGMLVANPMLLSLDVGFQLSFLAVLGIIHLSPIFSSWLKFIPEEKFVNLRSILTMTFSAQIFTLPIIIYNFGYVSVLAPLGNALIIPLLPLIMMFGFVFSLVGMLCEFLAWIFSWPAWLLLTYVIKIVDWLSSFSFAAYFFEISWHWLLLSFFFLALLTWRLKKIKLRLNI